MPVKYIITNRFDGIGSRIINLLISMSLAERLNAELLIHWPGNRDLSAESLNHLFADPIIEPYRQTPLGRKVNWMYFARTDEISSIRLLGDYGRLQPEDLERFDAIAVRCLNLEAIATLDGMSVEILKNDCKKMFSRLKIHPNVAAKVQRYPHLDRLSRAIGVHVRRGDLIGHKKMVHRERIVEIDVYFSALEAYEDRDIFLATDSKSVIKTMKKRYGKRLFHLGNSLFSTTGFSRSSGRDLQQAFAEMLLLSYCEKIIGGPSNFPRAAALLNGKVYEILKTENPAEEWENIKGNWGLS